MYVLDWIGLQFAPFEAWQDVREMLNEGSVDIACVRELWEEALRERSSEKRSTSPPHHTNPSSVCISIANKNDVYGFYVFICL